MSSLEVTMNFGVGQQSSLMFNEFLLLRHIKLELHSMKLGERLLS